MLQPVKSLNVGDIDRKQPLLILPQAYAAQFAAVKDPEVEYAERSATFLNLTVVPKSKPAGNRRYRLISHHGSVQVSVPRTWLREKVARPNDIIDVYEDPRNPQVFVLTLRRFHANGVSSI